MGLLNIVVVAMLCASALAEDAVIKACDGDQAPVCQVSAVRISPCPNPARCLLKKRKTTSISIDFTPNFNAQRLKTMVYGLIANQYQTFAGFGSDDACLYTSCPSESGQAQTLNYNLYIQKILPQGSYHLKWKIWNEENEAEECCFETNVKIK